MFSVKNLSRQKIPHIPFLNIKKKILGDSYELSLVFCGQERSRKINQQFRNKNYPANILSFPLEKNCGEIFITPLVVLKKNPSNQQYRQKILHLFIHGCLHLKGMTHSSKMELEELKLIKIFK
ncbi:MAG TPA: rRNA maturation RNase YbeY [Candidatus Atribacteria bacterium]|nr:rRNA maturation RNase YbeY [Candidatus Atribacteria bacterium]